MNTQAVVTELIAARKRAGLTQVEVAERIGTTQSAVSRLEAGHVEPSLGLVDRYASAVGERIVLSFGDRPGLEPREVRARRVKRALAGYRFDPWERDPTSAEQRSLVADGLTRERFEREATAR